MKTCTGNQGNQADTARITIGFRKCLVAIAGNQTWLV